MCKAMTLNLLGLQNEHIPHEFLLLNYYFSSVLWEALALRKSILWHLNKQNKLHPAHVAQGLWCSLETMYCLLMQLAPNEAKSATYYCVLFVL